MLTWERQSNTLWYCRRIFCSHLLAGTGLICCVKRFGIQRPGSGRILEAIQSSIWRRPWGLSPCLCTRLAALCADQNPRRWRKKHFSNIERQLQVALLTVAHGSCVLFSVCNLTPLALLSALCQAKKSLPSYCWIGNLAWVLEPASRFCVVKLNKMLQWS